MSRSWRLFDLDQIYRSCGARSSQSTLDKSYLCVEYASVTDMAHGSRMDTLDVKLLGALQDNGRLSNFELADAVGLSASQCSRRRAALEDAGTIASYHAHLNAEALGLDVVVFVQVTLARHSPDNSKRFLKLIESLEEVQEAYSLTGESDYLIKVTIADLKALSRLLNDVFLPHGSVAHVRSSIVLDRLKQTPRLPLGHLMPAQKGKVRDSGSSRFRDGSGRSPKRSKTP
jgi:DNA-binding Lrp family transcriptional regulator